MDIEIDLWLYCSVIVQDVSLINGRHFCFMLLCFEFEASRVVFSLAACQSSIFTSTCKQLRHHRLTSSASSHRTFNSFRCFYVVVCNHWRLFSIRCVTHCGLEPPEMVSFMETLTRAPHPAAFCLKLVMTCILSATLLLSLRWNARVKRSCCLCGWGCWVWRRRWAGLN